ncbi:MAG: hypothetical protein Q9208_002173 [Pyrenodesmia sp. 3 TL-2023]
MSIQAIADRVFVHATNYQVQKSVLPMERDTNHHESGDDVDEDDPYLRLNLSGLAQSKPVYLGLDSNAGLRFRQNLFVSGMSTNAPYLRGMSTVALGLNEACCQRGKGKVFMVAMLDSVPPLKGHTAEARKASRNVVRAFYRMPKLVYVPLRWSKKDQADWNSMTHTNRYLTLNARAGALMYKDLVMPVDLVYDPVEKASFQVDALIDDGSGCKVLLAIVPKAYLGWSWEFHQRATTTHMGGSSMDNAAGAWHVVDEDDVADLRVGDADQVVETLDEMYYAKTPGSLVWMESLLRGMIELDRQLKIMDSDW